jgi:hypothetical protein
MRRLLLFLGFLLGIVLLLIVVIGLNGDRSSNGIITANKVFSVDDYADRNSSVQATISGPVVGNDQFEQVRISVTPKSRTIDIISGYQGKVVNSKTYSNNRSAYQALLSALGVQDFGKVRETNEKEAGACATGRLYDFVVYDDSEVVSDTWAGSCTRGNTQNSAETSRVLNLFKKQITDYSEITQDLDNI